MAHAQFLAEHPADCNTSEHSQHLRNVRGSYTAPIARSDQILIAQSQATPDNNRPPSSTSTHAKACTQCGATRTPQWREGPLGPKTLCNACGVKQFRLNKRARDDGIKRRTPTPTKRKAVDAPRPPRARPTGHDSWLLEAARVAQESLTKGEDRTDNRSEHRRPPRKAAAKALLKSLEWAHGGEWVEPPRSMSDTSATSGITAQASDRAEEVAFEPRRAVQHPAAFGRETQAAVDLLTLCHSVVGERDGSMQADNLPMLDEGMDADELTRVVALSLPMSLPAALLDGVAAARDEMVAAFRAKEQADIAVRTVAKMLAHKQSEARAQQQRVRASIAHFHAALADIDLHCEQS